MRLPTYTDLSKEQDQVYLSAPLSGAILVSGPPGSGKTVMAFYRADTIAKKGRQPKVVMFNRVLEMYTQAVPASLRNLGQDRTYTFFSWLGKWWASHSMGNYYPQIAKFRPDWDRMQTKVLSKDRRLKMAVRNLGHVLLDEGQDFPPKFYQLLGCLLAAAEDSQTSISVFADENQRLTAERNSTLAEILHGLAIGPANHYRLTRNYRNTRQVAAAAACFYTGLDTGVPQLPIRSGPKPTVRRARDWQESVAVIVTYAAANDDLEIAVFVRSKEALARYFNELKRRLARVAPEVVVQAYESEDRDSALMFDQGGVVTVLCDQSAKGLEFDTVFVADLQQYRCDAANEQGTMMTLYVVSARAREELHFIYEATTRQSVPALKYLLRRGDVVEWRDGEKG